MKQYHELNTVEKDAAVNTILKMQVLDILKGYIEFDDTVLQKNLEASIENSSSTEVAVKKIMISVGKQLRSISEDIAHLSKYNLDGKLILDLE